MISYSYVYLKLQNLWSITMYKNYELTTFRNNIKSNIWHTLFTTIIRYPNNSYYYNVLRTINVTSGSIKLST